MHGSVYHVGSLFFQITYTYKTRKKKRRDTNTYAHIVGNDNETRAMATSYDDYVDSFPSKPALTAATTIDKQQQQSSRNKVEKGAHKSESLSICAVVQENILSGLGVDH